mmetsp:Transcript_15391/g.35731  ORF Transcript_15391/g.35731 Transcript_15391/m.35731 type:complete len:246 (+) Transcript_15391:231-968(+)
MSTNGWLSGELFGLSQIQLVLSLAAVALCVVFPLVVCLLYCCCWRCLSKEAAPAAAAAAPAAAPDHELDLARGQTWQGDAILPGQPPPLDPAEEAAQVVIDMHSDKLIAINGQRLDARRQGIALPYAPNVSTVVTHNAPNVGAMRPPVEAEGRAYAIRGGDYADDGGGEGYVDGDGGGGGGEEGGGDGHELDELLQWTEELDFDGYYNNWLTLATTGRTKLVAITVEDGPDFEYDPAYEYDVGED